MKFSARMTAVVALVVLFGFSGDAWARGGRHARRQQVQATCTTGNCGTTPQASVGYGYRYTYTAQSYVYVTQSAPTQQIVTPPAQATPQSPVAPTPPAPPKTTPQAAAPVTPRNYQLTDAYGQTWECPDEKPLHDYVTAINERRQAAPSVQQAAYGDPYGFTAWLNNYRIQNGRNPVTYDDGLAGHAAINNAAQQARGLGHHHMQGTRRQNAGMGAAQTVWTMWTASPAHQAALLDPTITVIGIAASGGYWTFNAN